MSKKVNLFIMNLRSFNFNYEISNTFKLSPVKSSAGISRNITVFKNILPINFRYKKLLVTHKSNGGRNQTGQKTLRTRGSRSVKQTRVVINYYFRDRSINFIAGFFMVPFYNKLISLLFLSSGSVTYLITSSKHKLFELTRMYTNSKYINNKYLLLSTLDNNLLIRQGFFLISQLPKNRPVSLLELLPEKGIQYVRSTGSHGTILKMDLRLNTSIIKLPSGVKKIFSTNSIGSDGYVALPTNKNSKNNKAGLKRTFGFKSIVRGVAMNPVDHPHGGRAKSIKYPRTP